MSVKDRPRLGRGIRSLISAPPIVDAHAQASGSAAGAAEARGADGLRHVPLDQIDPNPAQPRTSVDAAALAELVASVRQSGILQPILLRPVGGRYQLVAGQRRVEAARQAGLATIPAVVRADATDETQAEWALIENIHRQDLNAIERARAYKAYIERFVLTHAAAAERLGEDRTVITNFLRLLELNAGVQDLIARGLLSAGHAKVLAGVADAARQDALANRAVSEGLSVRKLEEAANAPAEEPIASVTPVAAHTRTMVAKSPHILELETDLSRKLGTKVRIFPSQKKNTGKLVIQYFSLDEFDRIVEKFDK
jgi:ParB family chromosome partitioning protein